MAIDRNKVRKSVAEYVYFLLDTELKGEVEFAVYDSRRRKLHDAISESMGVKSNDFKDTSIADGINDMVVPVEEFIEFHTDRIISKVYNRKVFYDGMEIQWDYKERIPSIIRNNKQRIKERIDEVDKVMEQAVA